MRYVYIKNGDAVDQLRRVTAAERLDSSGPDAFIGEFVAAHQSDDVLLLCRWRSRERLVVKRFVAESLPVFGSGLELMLRRAVSAFGIGIRMLKWRPDRILCGSTGEQLWVAVLVAKLLRVPIVHSRHNEIQERTGVGGVVTNLDNRAMKHCVGVVCHGPFLMRQVEECGIARERIFEFEVDLRDFQPSNDVDGGAQATALRDRFDRLMVFVGRMQRDKGIFDLLEAMDWIRGRVQGSVGLVYVGDGNDFESLKQEIGNKQLDANIVLTGRVPHRKIAQLMQCADVVVAPTRPEFPEGRCMVVLEALVLGVPVVAPDCGPFPFAIEHETDGLLFDAGSQQSLQEHLLGLLKNEGNLLTRLRQGARVSGQKLLSAHKSFATAVEQAFRSDAGGGVAERGRA